MYKVALFDLDGVVFNTEPQYTIFWESQFKKYYPETTGLAQKIKGQTLVQIYDKFFSAYKSEQAEITRRLNDFEQNMSFEYVSGFVNFVNDLKVHGLKTAVVTSSNLEKMKQVYRNHPEFNDLFDKIFTSEDFTKSKPDPDCYLKGAEWFGVRPSQCIGFEDSFNGLKSVRAAGMAVIGLSTTNTAESISDLSDVIVDSYDGLDYEKMCELIIQSH